MADKHAGGRPMKYATPELLQEAIDLYFESLDIKNDNGEKIAEDIPTISGLAYALDVDTDTLRNYAKRDKFFGIVKRARQKVEIALEKRLHNTAPTGSIFNLKCNFGWREDSPASANQAISIIVNNPHAAD